MTDSNLIIKATNEFENVVIVSSCTNTTSGLVDFITLSEPSTARIVLSKPMFFRYIKLR